MGDVRPIRDDLSVNAEPRERAANIAVHASPLVLFVILAVVVGRPAVWLGAFVFLAPALLWLTRAADEAHARPATVFAVVAGQLAASGWLLFRLPDLFRPFALLLPLALLLSLLGLVNLVLVSCSRTVRAWKGQTLDYPWIPARFAGESPDPGAS